MAIKTLAQLRTEAQIIRDETATGANTATRVGTWMDDVLDSLDSLKGSFWQQRVDNQYTVSAKRAIAAGIRTPLTNNALATNVSSPNGYADVWNTTTNQIEPIKENDAYVLRIDVGAWSDGAGANHFDMELDIGGSLGVIAANTFVFEKGATQPQHFSWAVPIFAGATFLANGGEIYVTPSANASFWDFGIVIQRTYTDITT